MSVTATGHMSWLHLASAICEVSGVFFLSVEAIKVKNLHAIFTRLQRFYKFINPRVEFVVGDSPKVPIANDKASSKDKLSCKGLLSVIWAGFVIIVIITPLVLILLPIIILLSSIEKHTETGVIGIIGFLLWVISFIINHSV